ncbi:hypothetical protein ACHAXS_004990 [Conticribra weissflogii]
MKLPSATVAILALVRSTAAFAPSATSSLHSPTQLNAVSKKDSYQITLLPGDGIGPEIMTACKEVLGALTKRCGFELQMTDALIGGAAIDEKGDPFPDESLEQCMKSDSVLLSCIGGYKWDSNPRELRPETGLLKMRKSMGLFANLRPAKVLPQLIDASTLKREVVEGVDVMVVRELTGDVYFGSPKGIDIVDGKRVGYNNMIYSEGEIERIARVAGKNVSFFLCVFIQIRKRCMGCTFLDFGVRFRDLQINPRIHITGRPSKSLYRAHGWPLLECKMKGVSAEKC